MPFRGKIRWRIGIPYVVLVLLAIIVLTVYFSDFVRRIHLSDLRDQLTAEARLVGDAIAPLLIEDGEIKAVDPVAKHWGELLEARVTIIQADGTVLGDSDKPPLFMENHFDRPEVQEALAEGLGISNRLSRTVGYKMMYAAIPIEADGQVLGVARVSLPLSQIERRIDHLHRTVLLVSLLVTLLAGLLGLVVAEQMTRPLQQLTRLAERIAQGDLGGRIRTDSQDEIGRLANSLNHMAAELQKQMTILDDQRNTLTTVLTYMADGLIITDETGHIQLINPAAARILDADSDEAVGERFAIVARHHKMIEIWRRCQECQQEQSETIELIGRNPFLRVVATPLSDTCAAKTRTRDEGSCLMLFQDLTQIRRLETVRRDFVSNISHELRTPLAGLKALVDTLRGGALEDPPAAQRFLDRMDAEVDTLTQMVQELLELSRIESGRVPLRLSPTDLAEIVPPPIERLRPQAERAEVELVVLLPPALPQVLADAERARQVVTNLVHNAIKFTPAGGRVTVEVEPARDSVIISVRDTGVGISADDLDRIFERFYKADRARSGGGTGLGLAIARHIIRGHGGRIWAESVEGQGSTFYFSLQTV